MGQAVVVYVLVALLALPNPLRSIVQRALVLSLLQRVSGLLRVYVLAKVPVLSIDRLIDRWIGVLVAGCVGGCWRLVL